MAQGASQKSVFLFFFSLLNIEIITCKLKDNCSCQKRQFLHLLILHPKDLCLLFFFKKQCCYPFPELHWGSLMSFPRILVPANVTMGLDTEYVNLISTSGIYIFTEFNVKLGGCHLPQVTKRSCSVVLPKPAFRVCLALTGSPSLILLPQRVSSKPQGKQNT